MTGHLDYDKHDPAGRGSGNSRNGTTGKTVLTDIGAVNLAVPRDRNGSFDPTARGLRDVLPEVVVPAVSFLQFLLTAVPVMAVLADLKDLPLSMAPAGTATSTSTASGTTSLLPALVAVADMPSEKLT